MIALPNRIAFNHNKAVYYNEKRRFNCHFETFDRDVFIQEFAGTDTLALSVINPQESGLSSYTHTFTAETLNAIHATIGHYLLYKGIAQVAQETIRIINQPIDSIQENQED